MAVLFDLPRELREEIWSRVCKRDGPTFPHLLYDLLRTNRLLRLELAPYLYATVIVHLLHPHQALQWIHTIGRYNSSCIRSLTLKFSTLGPASGTRDEHANLGFWSTSLKVMSCLDTLVYHYEPSQHYTQKCSGLDEHHPRRVTTFERAMEIEGIQGLDRLPRRHSCDPDVLEDLPASHSRPITHAVLAIDEPMPEINMMSFMKLLSLDMKSSLPQNLTQLPTWFFADHDFRLARTYTMIEDPQQQSVALTYRRQLASDHVQSPNLKLIFSNLPRLLYLRLGCPNVDSEFLTFLPSRVQTVDVSFQDPDPERVSRNLRHMRQRCEQLFTLAIVVSPFHDVVEMPNGGRPLSKGNDDEGEWEPFWDALRFVQGTGVKVWEGEGPCFKRVGEPL